MYEIKRKVCFGDIGRNGNLRLYTLPRWFQDISIEHSESVGIGLPFLEPRHLAWLLTSWQIEIKRLPDYNEEVTIQTWPFDFRGAFGYRNYRIFAADGEEIVSGYAIWLHTNLEKMSPARVLEEEIERYGFGEKLSMEYEPRKIALPDDLETIDTVVIPEHYVDAYQHLNNSLYVAIAEDYLDNKEQIAQILVDYRKQIKAGDAITVKRTKKDGKVYIAFFDASEELHGSLAFRLKG